ncbi:flagellar basal body rod protein FlgG [Salipaludibacillus daqingensis]|uniref:flagellar basal body rod protein FlgG n=1 Tax=Salipaludibacillus daqingensis TaxID=3041001 RepID=UPI002473538F|nr:flagellar basal body rod protein FlgG [Salipaludibacillus daqingensis]
MIRSLYSGIGGMKNFQTKLDVIGNNIANVNTFGYKKGRATFNDLVSQQMAGASTATGERGGTNPMQVGLGGGTSSIDTISTQGSLQSTGRDLDIAISGDGYFVVADGDANYYTRAGNFYLDEAGTLVNADGLRVQGVGDSFTGDIDGGDLEDLTILAGSIDPDSGATLESFNISQSGEINGVYSDGETRVLGQIAMANFSNPGGLSKVGNNTYELSNNSGPAELGSSGTGGRGGMVGSALEMSNVDLSEEFAEMIVSQRGFQANTRMITTSDEILQELVNLKR